MNEIFSEKVVTNRRTYFFDVKETKEGSMYLVIGELTQIGGDTERHRVMVFEENIEMFVEGLDKALDFMRGAEAEEGSRGWRSEREEETEYRGVEMDGGRRVSEILERIETKIDEIREHFK